MSNQKDTSGRLQLVLLALVFFGPLIVAAWLYFGGRELQPAGRTNHGSILQPIVTVPDVLPGAPITQHLDGHWLLIYPNDGACDSACDRSLYTLRQARLMLGNDMDRLLRVYLHGDIRPDPALIADNYAGTLALEDSQLTGLLQSSKPAGAPPGGFFLVDPLGNLVMYFRPDLDPGAMVEDISHLLELSRIG